jgi:acylphosphatase
MGARRYLFSGRVQGVGFRRTAERLSQSFQVHGFVRNLPDGRVELCAEGKDEEVDGFIQKVRTMFSTQIQDVLEEPMALQNFSGFKMTD